MGADIWSHNRYTHWWENRVPWAATHLVVVSQPTVGASQFTALWFFLIPALIHLAQIWSYWLLSGSRELVPPTMGCLLLLYACLGCIVRSLENNTRLECTVLHCMIWFQAQGAARQQVGIPHWLKRNGMEPSVNSRLLQAGCFYSYVLLEGGVISAPPLCLIASCTRSCN